MAFLRVVTDQKDLAGVVADLLGRLTAVVALGLAHADCHPRGYDNPTGRLMREALRSEARRLSGGGGLG